MFYRMEDGTFRLFRPGDNLHPLRAGKIHPVRVEIAPKYYPLLDWYGACGSALAPGKSPCVDSNSPVSGGRVQNHHEAPYTYEVEGESGIWFYRNGRRIERRLSRGQLEAALRKST